VLPRGLSLLNDCDFPPGRSQRRLIPSLSLLPVAFCRLLISSLVCPVKDRPRPFPYFPINTRSKRSSILRFHPPLIGTSWVRLLLSWLGRSVSILLPLVYLGILKFLFFPTPFIAIPVLIEVQLLHPASAEGFSSPSTKLEIH